MEEVRRHVFGGPVVCFRYVPASLRPAGDQTAALNTLNRALMAGVQRDGDSYLSNARIGEAFALRACIVNFRTRTDDAAHLLETIRRLAARTGVSV